jgi:WD40 repeat protein
LIQLESKLWASGTGDGNIIFWNILDMDYPLFILEGHKYAVWCVLKMQKSNYVLSGSGDSTLRLWDYSRKKCKKVIINGDTNVLNLVNINRKMIACLSTDGCIRFWNVCLNLKIKKIVIFDSEMIVCCSDIINNRLQLIGGSNKEIKLFDYKFKNKNKNYFLNAFCNKSSVKSLTILAE